MPVQPQTLAAREEAGFIAQISQGDREAFRLLYGRYSAPLFSLALRLVSDAGAAEELLQDAFVKIWRHAAAYDPQKSGPFTWAVTIVRRTCIDYLRKRVRRLSTTPLPADDETLPAYSADEKVRAALENEEDSQQVRRALSELTPNPRRALELALFSEMTHAEIAQKLAQPIGTVKSWIRRGLLELRTSLTDTAS